MSKKHYRLSSKDLRFERQELRFQRQMNGHRYMTWAAVVKKVQPDRTYQTGNGYTKEVAPGDQLLETLHQRVLSKSCTFIETVTEVPEGFEQPTADYWITSTDPDTGRKLVYAHQDNVWDTKRFTEPPPPPKVLAQSPVSDADVMAITLHLIENRLSQYPQTDHDSAQSALETTRLTVRNVAARSHAQFHNLEQVLITAAQQGLEAFDRAYNLARVENAGINLSQHPEFRSYQTFFEMGMLPPSHHEMADRIIQLFGPTAD